MFHVPLSLSFSIFLQQSFLIKITQRYYYFFFFLVVLVLALTPQPNLYVSRLMCYFLQLQEQATEKRRALEDACIKSEADLKESHRKDVDKTKIKLEKHIQTMLRSAAHDEGFALGK